LTSIFYYEGGAIVDVALVTIRASLAVGPGSLHKQILQARSHSTDSISPQRQCTFKTIGRQQTSQSSIVENVPDDVSKTEVKTAPQ